MSGERASVFAFRDADYKKALATQYGQGVAHGFETTLRLFLGETVDGAVGFLGPRSPESEGWARMALAKLADA